MADQVEPQAEKRKKPSSYLWPIMVIVVIIVLVASIAVLSEQRKVKPEAKPDVKPTKPEVVAPNAPSIPAPISPPERKLEYLVCVGGDLYLHVPPLAPYRLYYRPADRFVPVPCETRRVEVK